MREVAAALRRQSEDLIEHGLARDEQDVESHAALVEELHRQPDRRDLAWRLGLNEQVTDERARMTELRNFLTHLVLPTRSARGRA